MPQDSLRSVIYRSFVTCDDPKGVVQCGTIRKSKSSLQKMEREIENQQPHKNSNTSATYKAGKREMVGKGIKEESHIPSSSQLLEVSKGAHKLNEMIDSWSMGLNLHGQSKDIAKDLLKGALDLQQSLIMLGKLQEASRYMSQSKRRQKNFKIGKEDEMSSARTELNYQIFDREFLEPRPSVGGSSRNCINELREAIRDSLTRNNLLPMKTTPENAHLHQRSWDWASEKPSTSSSQSSTFYSGKFDSAESSLSSTAVTVVNMVKGPNLIARLMGLEAIPSKPMLTTSSKQLESTRSRRRPIFENDMPKARNPQLAVQRVDSEQRRLKDILDTMQFKGLLKGDSARTFNSQSRHSDPRFQRGVIDDAPPIVLIKPLHAHDLDSERLFQPLFPEVECPNARKVNKNSHVKQAILPQKAVNEEGTLSSKRIARQVDAGVSPIKRLDCEVVKDCEEVAKPDYKEITNNEKASTPTDKKPHKKEAADSKGSRIKIVSLSSRKPAEKETVKSKTMSRSQDQSKVITTKLRKPANASNITKHQMPQRQSNATPNYILNKTFHTASPNSRNLKKSHRNKEKPVRKPDSAEVANGTLRNNLPNEDISVVVERHAAPADEDHESQIEEQSSDKLSVLSDVMPLVPKPENANGTAEAADNLIDQNKTNSKCLEPQTHIKALLLDSPSFLSHAEELFDLSMHFPNVTQASGITDFGTANSSFSLDCANELVQRRGQPDSQTIHPMLLITCAGNLRICISFNQLVEEVCDGLETLSNFSKLAGENFPNNIIYGLLDRDIKSNGVVSGIWDLGWKNYFSMCEIEQAIIDMEKVLLTELIKELLV